MKLRESVDGSLDESVNTEGGGQGLTPDFHIYEAVVLFRMLHCTSAWSSAVHIY
jgi:hypothetical protein